jgi:hypothetical protein
MKVRILRQAVGHVNGVSLRHYRPNQLYEIPPSLANYMVAEGLAMFEMRNAERRSILRTTGDRRSTGGSQLRAP